MIISCKNCHKKFDIDASLIPEKGRLVQCNSCNHKWFFKNETIKEKLVPFKIDNSTEEIKQLDVEPKRKNIENLEDIELLDEQTKEINVAEKTSINIGEVSNLDFDPKIGMPKNKKNYNILGLTVVFIISVIAMIIVIDTFQVPIGKIIPNIEFLLYSLYETINDIKLFIKDLI